MSTICLKCGRELKPGAVFCGGCGTSIQPVQSQDQSGHRVEFALSPVWRKEKGVVSVSNLEVKTSIANFFMWFIPTGREEHTYRLDTVQGSWVNRKFKFLRVLFGILFIFFGIALPVMGFVDPWITGGGILLNLFAGLAFFGLGIINLRWCTMTVLTIHANGINRYIAAPTFDAAKIYQTHKAIQDALLFEKNAHLINQTKTGANIVNRM